MPPKEDAETIGHRIARLRKNLGLTQTELAKRIGITQYVVSDYEIGRAHLSAKMLIKFSFALGVKSDELLGIGNIDNTKTNSSLKIMKRFKEIEKLPTFQQKTILKSIDMMIDSAKRKTT